LPLRHGLEPALLQARAGVMGVDDLGSALRAGGHQRRRESAQPYRLPEAGKIRGACATGGQTDPGEGSRSSRDGAPQPSCRLSLPTLANRCTSTLSSRKASLLHTRPEQSRLYPPTTGLRFCLGALPRKPVLLETLPEDSPHPRRRAAVSPRHRRAGQHLPSRPQVLCSPQQRESCILSLREGRACYAGESSLAL